MRDRGDIRMPYRAGFWIRLLATVIDVIAMMLIAGGVAVATDMLLSGTAYSIADGGFEVLIYVIWLGYTSLEIWTAATPGKMLLRLRIVEQDCSPAEFSRRVLRWSTKWLGMMLALLFTLSDLTPLYWLAGLMNTVVLIGCLAAANDDRLTWHDQWAHTAVCRVPRRYQAFAAMVPPPRFRPRPSRLPICSGDACVALFRHGTPTTTPASAVPISSR